MITSVIGFFAIVGVLFTIVFLFSVACIWYVVGWVIEAENTEKS